MAENAASIALVDAMIAADKPVAAVCHAPNVLRHTRDPGEFIDLRPHGMVAADMDIGPKVNAIGEMCMTVLRTCMLEARRVNSVDLAWARPRARIL